MSSEVSYLSLSLAVQDLHCWALRSVFEMFTSDGFVTLDFSILKSIFLQDLNITSCEW